MVKAALDQKCQHLDWVWRGNLATPLGHILGRIPANVKFEVIQELADGSYMSWIAPDRKSREKRSHENSCPSETRMLLKKTERNKSIG